jgi:hypothetical protein
MIQNLLFFMLFILLVGCSTEPKTDDALEDITDAIQSGDASVSVMEDQKSSCFVNAKGEMVWMRSNNNGEIAKIDALGGIQNFEDVKSNKEVNVTPQGNGIQLSIGKSKLDFYEKAEVFSGKLNPMSPLTQYLAIKKNNTFSFAGNGKETFSGTVSIENDSNYVLKVLTPFQETMMYRKRGESLLKTTADFKTVCIPLLEFKKIQSL